MSNNDVACLKRIQNIYKSLDTCLEFCWLQHFSLEISNFYYIKKYRQKLDYKTSFLFILFYFVCFVLFLPFFEFWKVILINITAIFIMSAKLAPLVLLNIKIFWKKYYDVIISAHDSWIKLYCRCGYMTKVW